MSVFPGGKSARLFGLHAFAPGRTDFATCLNDRLTLKLRPSTPRPLRPSKVPPSWHRGRRRLMDCWVAVPADTGDELDRLIDLAHACVAGTEYP